MVKTSRKYLKGDALLEKQYLSQAKMVISCMYIRKRRMED